MNSNALEKGALNMEVPKVFESEYRFCLILWENEPVKSSQLVELCKEQLGWKPTTTYTVIKRLSERGVLKNENTVVTSLVSKDELSARIRGGVHQASALVRRRDRRGSADDRSVQKG